MRTYGFDVDTGYSSCRGEVFEKGTTFGHTGFTGTMFWMDPGHDCYFILLINSVHPDGKGKTIQLRKDLATVVGGVLLGEKSSRRSARSSAASGRMCGSFAIRPVPQVGYHADLAVVARAAGRNWDWHSGRRNAGCPPKTTMSRMRKLLLAAVVVLIAGSAIAIICVVNREEDAGAIVMVVFGSVFACSRQRRCSSARVQRPHAAGTTQATDESREILRRAHRRSQPHPERGGQQGAGMSSLDAGKCRHCGNPPHGQVLPQVWPGGGRGLMAEAGGGRWSPGRAIPPFCSADVTYLAGLGGHVPICLAG